MTRKPFPRTPALLVAAVVWLAVTPAAASLSVYMSPEAVAERADLVVEGTVLRTASGYDPETGRLATYVSIEVETLWKGRLPDPVLVVREPGGRYGDLSHEVDAVPRYRVGERVLTFLEGSRDGSLRTAGMFFGKFRLDDTVAERALDGSGRILGRAAPRFERFVRADLIAAAATSVPRRGSAHRLRATPPEYDRLRWDAVEGDDLRLSASSVDDGLPDDLSRSRDEVGTAPLFVPISSSNPTRWTVSDSGGAVTVHVDPAGNPLGDDALAVQAISAAAAAWTEVPESRLALQLGNTAYDYLGQYGASPATSYNGVNVVLFDDPFDDIADPSGCSGVLAIGGYWRSGSTGAPVNGVTFHPALQLYVIFNNDFQCFLGNFDNLAEVATHELGHGLGFGHSTVGDAVMRSMAYGGRGARLGDDDRDAAHCVYPHTLSLHAPNGGETIEAGSSRTILWSGTAEAGPNEGEVRIEWSSDGGQSWQTVAGGEPHDGAYDWLVPDAPGGNARVRVIRPSRAAAHPSPFVGICSGDASDASFAIASAVRIAGGVPDGSLGGSGLRAELRPDSTIALNWESSCSGDADGYAVYRGSLELLRAGLWDHQPVTCAAGPDLGEVILASPGNVYFLVAPTAGTVEGHLGASSDGTLRPPSLAACLDRETIPTCL